jgi:diadenosine tetraphosphate (Ap4A) HIT family hydrolase
MRPRPTPKCRQWAEAGVGNLDHLWAGWRSEFVTGATGATDVDDSGARRSACVFCDILASGLADDEVHIVWRHRAGQVIVMLNAYPYTSGHLMAMPVRHVSELEDLEVGEAADLWESVAHGVRALKGAYKPEGINIGANLGRAAGAGVPGHFHMHVLPRWAGDTNFMTSVADARVLPEPLCESARKLRSAWPTP